MARWGVFHITQNQFEAENSAWQLSEVARGWSPDRRRGEEGGRPSGKGFTVKLMGLERLELVVSLGRGSQVAIRRYFK